MRYFDIAMFEVDPKLQTRLGYYKIHAANKDIYVSTSLPDATSYKPCIVLSSDQETLIRAVREANTIGIIIEGSEPSKKVIGKAKEYGKTVFIPAGKLTASPSGARQPILRGLRKIFFASHAIKAKTALVSMASSRNQLLSSAQMMEIANLISRGQAQAGLFGGKIL